ncbi:MAG: DMT family transporter [Acidimicrobiales bacterium]
MTDPADPHPLAGEALPRRALGGVTLAIVLWTSNVYFVRRADDILAFTTWRMVFAIPVLAATGLIVRLRPSTAPPTTREPLGGAVRLGLIGVGVLFGFSALVNFAAINETTLVNVGVIHALQPAVVALIAGRFLGEHVDWRLLARVSVAMGGAVAVAAASAGVGTWSLHGDLLAVLGLGLNSLWFLAGRWVRTRTDLDATSYMAVVFGTATATLIVVATVAGRSLSIDRSTVVLAAMTALFGTIGHTLVAWAHRFVPVAISSLFLLSQPALIAVLAWVAFGETLRPLHLVGAAIVVASLVRIVTTSGSAPLAPPGDLPDALDDTPDGNVVELTQPR